MTHTHFIFSDLNQNVAPVRALRSLRVGDAEAVAEVIDVFSGNWSIQTSDDYDGYLFMLIEPRSEHANQLPTYMVSGKTDHIELAAVDGDDYQLLGRFGDIYGLTAELTARLIAFTGDAG